MGSSEKVKERQQNIRKIKTIIRTLPDKPGVYQFLDEKDKVIYIGKAKSLKKRVSSYFSKDTGQSGKTTVMVKKIAGIQHVVVDTELDALLLENNLIKKYQPRYNVNLKDDKSFPWLCIKNERFPRIFSTRHVIHDGSEYYGPYASVKLMNTLLDLIRQLYPLRTCKFSLSEKNIRAKKFKVCLEYHLGNCKGPCEGLQAEEDYNESIAEIREIIKGNISNVVSNLRKLMKQYADLLAFEKAQVVKEKLNMLERYQSKSLVVNPRINNVDVFSIISDQESAYVNYLRIINGAIVQAHTIEMKKKLDETDSELLTLAVADLRQRFESDSQELILPFNLDFKFPAIIVTIPKIGDKKQLLDLSERNAKYYKLEKRKQMELVDPERHTKRILSTMMKDLRLPELPIHIECFDNSNIQGDYPVAAMVCFKNAKPSKADYRHFNINTVAGPNDYASMEEVILRRYKRIVEEQQTLPQLIIIDGGKGQLSSAVGILEKIGLRGKISIIAIAEKLEELYFPNDPVPLHIDKKSETLRLIQYMRDEAHHFGITHYRKKHEKGVIKSTLTEIDGIGEGYAKKLLYKFKSVKRIGEASLEELQQAIGKVKGKQVYDFFQKKN
ncbi:MAG: excinuclease ABC subunit UvrC [Bacteroidales bacterium]|jgi:excinuclease ABC subunit C|nr:excinuclease ABC subunit UvrC [Bacteroidales bacterium]MDI9591723.1 excinuclease ABC subunit UvrC [Bacteroidota bacterium]HOF80162.1 excinuclease ABC subunit UvrC [Bacteroidales bacterium]HOR75482.1 excinuclease ABC subunit UvrC [Bacteroidales bacterium]HPL10893.1 excinuclease ABC subunit UvrC [Bacteroidales bacterium]